MFKAILITFMFLGILMYVGYFSYQKLLVVSFASNYSNYFENVSESEKTSILTINDCEGGNIPGIPSYQGKLLFEPYNVALPGNGKLKIINADKSSHTIGITLTKVWEVIEPGDSFDLDTKKLPNLGKWYLSCDGINLGVDSPTIFVQGL